jgi:hypothetical protein
MHVFVVWEPILKSDFMAPTTGALRRISDPRARHYWDDGHVLADVMKRDARPPQPKHECCDSDGVLWDLVAIYPKGARWDATLPPAVVFDGPVVRVTDQISAALTAR